jgi:thioesterase domain-containing protein
MVPGFLAELRSRDVQVWAEGDRLRCTAPVGVLTRELRQQLQERKNEILAFLRSAEALAQQQPAIVPLQPRGTRTPVFAVAGHNGDVFCYRALAQHLGEDQPFFGLQPPGLDGKSEPLARVEDLAAYFADQIRAFQPHGPYILAGFCAGGTVAFELAQQLQRGGAGIRFVALFACPYSPWYRFPPQLRRRLAQQMERFSGHARALASLSLRELREYVTQKLRARKARREAAQAVAGDPVLIRRAKVERVTLAAVRRYTPRHFAGRLALFSPTHQWVRSFTPRWGAVAQGTEEYLGPDGCTGDTMLLEPHVAGVADLFRRCREGFDHGDPQSALAVASSPDRGGAT